MTKQRQDRQGRKKASRIPNPAGDASGVARATATSTDSARQWLGYAAPIVIVLAILLVYANAFQAPFLFDDSGSITGNKTIRHLWPLTRALSPPGGGETVSGRPLLNLSLAVNYAISDDSVWSYHAVNVIVHMLAALVLFGILRRTFLRPPLKDRCGEAALPLAFCATLLWALHPLQTESVTYIVQRAESLVSLFYLLTLYCFIRGCEAPPGAPRQRRKWFALSVLACTLGVGSKEVIATAPIVVLLYDRSFVSGSFMEALRKRRATYLCLCATWILLGLLVFGTGRRGGTAGFGVVAVWRYARIQYWAVLHYLFLSFWPHPLIFDYGVDLKIATTLRHASFAVTNCLLLATACALWRRWAIGFAAAAFFILLAPTTSILPVATEAIAEHRMYLPLACVVSIVATALFLKFGERAIAVCLIAAVALGAVTFRRNMDYRSRLSIWGDTVAKRPYNSRAQTNLGLAYDLASDSEQAIEHYNESLKIVPDDPKVLANIAKALVDDTKRDRTNESLDYFVRALELAPNDANTNSGYGSALTDLDMPEKGLPFLEKSLKIDGENAGYQYCYGNALVKLNRLEDAERAYATAISLRRDFPQAEKNIGIVCFRLNRDEEAIKHMSRASALQPDNPDIMNSLAYMLFQAGRLEEARARYETVLKVRPDYEEAKNNYDLVLAQLKAARTNGTNRE